MVIYLQNWGDEFGRSLLAAKLMVAPGVPGAEFHYQQVGFFKKNIVFLLPLGSFEACSSQCVGENLVLEEAWKGPNAQLTAWDRQGMAS